MKRALALALATALSLSLLTGCGNKLAAGSSSSSTSQSASSGKQDENEQLPLDSGSAQTPEATIKEFSMSVNDLIGKLNNSLEDAHTSGALAAEVVLSDPDITEDKTDSLGYHEAYSYKIGPGASIVVYAAIAATPGDGYIRNITVMTMTPDIDQSTLETVGYIVGALEGGLAGDEAESVDTELNKVPFPNDSFAMYTTAQAEFMQVVQDKCLVFSVTPV